MNKPVIFERRVGEAVRATKLLLALNAIMGRSQSLERDDGERRPAGGEAVDRRQPVGHALINCRPAT